MQGHHRRRSSKTILLPRITANNNVGVNGYAKRMTVHLAETTPDTTYLYGYALLTATFLLFITLLYAMLASKYMPDLNIKFLDWIKYDEYYCFVVPVTAIAWIYWVLWNWMGMKFFRHN